MEKKPMYAVMTTSSSPDHQYHHHPFKPPRLWVAWASAGVALVALVVTGVTAAMALRHEDRANLLEERLMEMESKVVEVEGKMVEMEGHMLEVLEYSLAAATSSPSHDYFDYDDDDDAEEGADDQHQVVQAGPYEHLTIQRVVRRRREVNNEEEEEEDSEIQSDDPTTYDQAYGNELKGRTHSGLRLYESLQRTRDTNDPTSPEVTIEVSESPIKPYHRDGLLDSTGSVVWPLPNEISSLWVPKKPRRKFPGNSLSTRNLVSDAGGNNSNNSGGKINRRRQAITQRRSRTKRLHDSERREGLRHQPRTLSNPNPVNVQFRHSRVKATSRHDGFDAGLNSVVPQPAPSPAPAPDPLQDSNTGGAATVVVPQGAADLLFSSRQSTEYTGFPTRNTRNKEKPRKRRLRPRKRVGGGGRRRSRSPNTLAHFVADTTSNNNNNNNNNNNTSNYGTGSHHAWTPAAWMDKVGLNRKYTLRAGGDSVLVKEAGLYYLYAQVLYEGGRFGTGFQVLVDDIPIMECTLAPAQPSPSCHTAGASYLPRHAVVKIVDNEAFTRPVRSHYNTYFGLVKLMDAPDTAEQLLLP